MPEPAPIVGVERRTTSVMDTDQAKLVGGALSVLLVFLWTAALPEGSPWRPSNEVAQAVTVIAVAVVDRILAGRKLR